LPSNGPKERTRRELAFGWESLQKKIRETLRPKRDWNTGTSTYLKLKGERGA